MKWIVGILAALSITACGVGVDDPEGLAAAGYAYGSTTSALTSSGSGQASEEQAAGDSGAAGKTTTSGSVTESAQSGSASLAGGGTVSAPQDPIPAYEGKGGVPDPFVDGLPSIFGQGADPRTGK